MNTSNELGESLDLNIHSYSTVELLTILDITEEELDRQDIINKSDYYITKFEREDNQNMSDFFEQLQTRLLSYIDEGDDEDEYEYENENENENENEQTLAQQVNDWNTNEYLPQDDKTQYNKNTARKQKIDVLNHSSVPMKRKHLGINNTYSVPVIQDVLNPTLKNTRHRIINLDSIYRQSSENANHSSTDYTLDLSEPLVNVLSLRLYSFQIPYTWYAIDTSYGNTFLWISFVDVSGNILKSVRIEIEPGNYTSSSIITALENSMITAGFDFSGTIPTNTPFTFNANNNKLTLNLFGATYDSGVYTIDSLTLISFFDLTSQLTSEIPVKNVTCEGNIQYINQSLGWNLGFRVPYLNVNPEGNTASSVLNLYGPKYFILVIDDLNQNHLNDGLVGITEPSKTFKLPTYYSPDLPYTCVDASPLGNTAIDLSNPINIGTDISDKMGITYKNIPQVLPSAPRQLTQTQLYTINEIIKNNEKTVNYKIKSPTVSDTLAIIPIKLGSAKMGDAYVDFSGSLQDNKRVYFGPVNIERLRVKLYDDRGNIVNLNGNDWSVTIICESLYQY